MRNTPFFLESFTYDFFFTLIRQNQQGVPWEHSAQYCVNQSGWSLASAGRRQRHRHGGSRQSSWWRQQSFLWQSLVRQDPSGKAESRRLNYFIPQAFKSSLTHWQLMRLMGPHQLASHLDRCGDTCRTNYWFFFSLLIAWTKIKMTLREPHYTGPMAW